MPRKSSSKVTTTKTKTSSPKRTTKRRTSSTKSASKTVIVEKKVTPTVKPVSVTKPVVNTTKKVTTTKKPVRVTKPVEITPKKVTTTASTTKSASKPVNVEKKVAPTPKPVVEAKPELIKPEVELISFESYVQDIKNRIAIHNYEFALFVKDCRFGINFVTNYLQDSYKKQFNL